MHFYMMEPSPEAQAEMERRRQLVDMAHHESVRATKDLIDNLSEEHLTTLKTMLMTTVGDDQARFAMHTMGWINIVLFDKFGVCLACSEKHGELDPNDAHKEPASG